MKRLESIFSLKVKAKLKSLILNIVSIATIAMLLLPLGLKLDHVIQHHKIKKECLISNKHYHSPDKHDNFIDVYFLPLVISSFSDFSLMKNVEIVGPIFTLSLDYYQSCFNKLSVRGPPH